MYCKKCGTELKEGLKFCTGCGAMIEEGKSEEKTKNPAEECTVFTEPTKIKEKTEETSSSENVQTTPEDNCDEYIFLNEYKSRKRLLSVVKKADRIIEILLIICTIAFIIDQVMAAEGYKISVYVLRYLSNFSRFFILGLVSTYMKEILEYKVSQKKEHFRPEILLCAKVLQLVFMCMAFVPFLQASEGDNLEWVMLIAYGDISDLIVHFKSQIWCIIIAGLIQFPISKFMIKDDEK